MKGLSTPRLLRSCAIAVPLLMFLTLVSWSFASPVGSSPDDDFHLASIWCGLGERAGLCQDSGDSDTRLVPASLLTAPCYRFDATESAACWNAAQLGMSEVEWMNTVGLYPPVFYATMAVFASTDVTTSVIAMRIVNSAIFVGLLTAVFFALPPRLRPALVISTLVTSVPLGLFIVASTNPSSWVIAPAASIWLCAYATMVTTGRRQAALGALTVIATLIGAGARADAAVFAVFGALIAVMLGMRRGARLLIPSITLGLVLVVSAFAYLSAGQSATLTSGLPTDNPPLTGSQHLANLLGVPILWWGAFGASGLGWLDTVPPAAATVLAFAVFAAAIFLGIHRLRWRRGLALAASFAALWLVPFVILAQSRAIVGTQVQSRYLLPLMIILVGVASLSPGIIRAWSGARAAVAGVALAVAMSIALHVNIRRYTTGTDSAAIDPGLGAEWWWPVGPSPLTVWLVGSLAFLTLLVLTVMAVQRLDRMEPAHDPGSVPARRGFGNDVSSVPTAPT